MSQVRIYNLSDETDFRCVHRLDICKYFNKVKQAKASDRPKKLVNGKGW